MKKGDADWVCATHNGNGKCTQNFFESFKASDDLQELGTGRMIEK
jgi:hypothetical protein